MDFKIGVLADSFRLGAKGGILKAAELGAQGVQLYATDGELAPENMTRDKINEINDIVMSSGLVVSAICGDFAGGGFRNRDQNPWRIEKSKRIMDLALELRSNIVTTHIGVIPQDDCEMRCIMAQACEQLGVYGDNVGAYFAIETGPEPALTLKGFLDSLQSNAVRVNLDPANLVMVIGEDAAHSAETLKDYIVHTHAKDGVMLHKTNPEIIYGYMSHENMDSVQNLREVPLGQGQVDFDSYLHTLDKNGYHGFLTIEREVGADPVQDIKYAIDFLKSKI